MKIEIGERIIWKGEDKDKNLFEIISKKGTRNYPEKIKKKDRKYFIRINKKEEYCISHKDIHNLLYATLKNDVEEERFIDNIRKYYIILEKVKKDRKNESS